MRCYLSINILLHLIFNMEICLQQMLSCFNHVQLFATLWTCSLPVSSVRGVLQARTLEWVAMPSSRRYISSRIYISPAFSKVCFTPLGFQYQFLLVERNPEKTFHIYEKRHKVKTAFSICPALRLLYKQWVPAARVAPPSFLPINYTQYLSIRSLQLEPCVSICALSRFISCICQ